MIAKIYWEIIRVIIFSYMNVPILPISAFGNTVLTFSFYTKATNKFGLKAEGVGLPLNLLRLMLD